MREVLSAKLDIIFKKLFTENQDLLQSFLCSILDISFDDVEELTIINPEILPNDPEGKQGALDLKVNINDKIVNIELQLHNEGNFKDRSLFYWTKNFADELKSGEDYIELKQTISINILNFNLFKCSEPYSKFALLETTRNEQLTDKCSILFFELKKIDKKINVSDRKLLWLQLINAETKEEFDMLEKTQEPAIRKAVIKLHEMSEDEKTKEIARSREKWLHDRVSALGYAKRTGMAEGMEKGIAKGMAKGMAKGHAKGLAEGEEKAKKEMIDKMRLSGMTEEQIQHVINIDI